MLIETNEHQIELFDEQHYLIGRLTFFQLPNQQLVLEQLFFPGKSTFQDIKTLIEEFLKQIPVTIEQVMILDPAARTYIDEYIK